METQLQSLIDKIKEEGIDEATKKSEQIIKGAQNQASRILADTENKAAIIIKEAREDAARTEEAGKKALEQAGRDLVLSVRKNIMNLFSKIIQKEVGEVLNGNKLADIIEKLLAHWEWNKPGVQGVEILINEEDRTNLQDILLEKLQAEMKKGVSFKPVKNIESGFRIGERGGTVHYDFTDQAIAEMLARYLNPRLAEIIKDAKPLPDS